ncbi:ankyrin repeat domain-containing protein [Sphingopyxis sp.]|jgi:ankyrin repeat protein|uniref:ankyrin repeat domain-containing protein n=1 Tax=Sphingopyxis sp. TaxID=1908224 RepID=UPI003F6F71E4
MAVSNKRRATVAVQLLWVWLCIVAVGASALVRAAEAAPSISQQIAAGARPGEVRRLLDAGADPLLPDRDGNTAIHAAATTRDPAVLKLLLARGLDPDTPNHVNGRTPLVAAMLAERDRQFAMLLAAGASVALADRMGNTPLHVAAQINEPRRVLALLDAGAPALARNAQRQTFQRYLFMIPDELLEADTLQARRDVASWLRRHGIALETKTP